MKVGAFFLVIAVNFSERLINKKCSWNYCIGFIIMFFLL